VAGFEICYGYAVDSSCERRLESGVNGIMVDVVVTI
jgi:hypothetical protein